MSHGITIDIIRDMKRSGIMRIGILPLKIHIKRLHINMQEAEKRFEDAAKHNIDLLVLPEMALTGINEKPPLDKGDRVHVFKLGSISLSMLICGDLFDGRVISMLKTSDRINLLAVPMCRCFDGKTPDIDRWENEERRVYVEAVRELVDYILISNALEVSANESFGGGLIISRANSVLAETKHGTDEIVWIDVAL